MSSTSRALWAAAAGCTIMMHVTAARVQEKPQEQRPAATFRSGVDLVTVDVSVVDPRGRPVSGLLAGDFVLTVDGRPRKLASVQFIAQARDVESPARREAFSTNAGAGSGRLIMLVVDQSNIRAGASRAYIDAASRFVDRLSPADRVGLTVIPGAGTNVDFTANHALVKTLLTRVTGLAGIPVGGHHIGVAEALEVLVRENEIALNQLVDRECPPGLDAAGRAACVERLRADARLVLAHLRGRTGDLLVALRSLLHHLATISEPKTVVLVSEGLILEDRRSQLTFVGPLAAAARTSLYVLRLDALTFDAADQNLSFTANEDRQLGIEGLEDLAGRARGTIFAVASSPERVFDRLALELSGYYLLSFEPERSDRDGNPHRIDVKVRREGLEVRARREFAVDTTRSAPTEEDLLAESLRSPLLAADIPVAVTTYTFQDVASHKLKLMIAAEIDRRATAPGAVALGYALVDNTGKLAGTDLQKDVQPSKSGGTTQRYQSAVLIDPGIYSLKLAVVDAEGRRGSVEHSFRAQLQSAGQLHFGELMLASVTRGAAREVWPLVTGEVADDSLHAYLEMYSDAAAQLENATVTLEVATDANGRTLESGVVTLQEVEDGGRRTAEGSVPVVLLPPGDYVARAVVSVRGSPVARVARSFHVARPLVSEPSRVVRPAAPAAGGLSSAALAMGIGPFRSESVLKTTVLQFFVDRLFTPQTVGSAPALRPITDAARAARFDAVLAEIDKLDSKAAAQVVPTFLRGVALFARGDFEPAATRFREAIRLQSDFFPAVFYLGACYAAGGRDREAAGAWQTSLVTEHEAPFVFTLLADALLRLGEASQAIELLREAGGLWPDDDDVRMRMGMAFAQGGFAAEAIATLDPYLVRHPADYERLFLAMRLLYETVAGGRSIGTPEEDRARFARYAKAYTAAGGMQDAIVEQWRMFIESKTSAKD